MNFLNFLTETVPAETVAAATEAAAEAAKLGFNPMNFVSNLKYMGVGMLTIFIIIGAIILATMLINKVFSAKKED